MDLILMSKGYVTFTFDCEGKWGMLDHPKDWNYELSKKNLESAYEFILTELHKNNIPATFAFVGAFTETQEYFLENSMGKLTSSSHSSWLSHCRDKIFNKDEEGWFEPDLLNKVRESGIHEIATHGYTHIPFDRLDKKSAKIELNLIKEWSDRKHLECSTMVFPRNIIGHYEFLKDYKILGFRDLPDNISTRRIPKSIKTLLDELSVLKKSQQIEEFEPVRIPGGIFINWRHGYRKYIPSSVSLRKYKSMINDAVDKKGIAHFWIHPHNFITSPSTKELFTELCKIVSQNIYDSKILVKKQNDFLY